jgi:carbamoyltransferase
MKNKMNDVKFRQAWRPVAPLLLEEDLGIFFEDAEANYFMTTIASIKPEKRSEIPAVVHIDGTARYQTVNQEQNEKTYKLLKSLKSIK